MQTMATMVGDTAKHIWLIYSGVIIIYSIIELIRVRIKLKKEMDELDFYSAGAWHDGKQKGGGARKAGPGRTAQGKRRN
jgi:hypothetical protein